MPVRSLRSSVLRWPDRDEVDRAVREWAAGLGAGDPNVERVGYFGSYARGDWGVGSDLDVIVVTDSSTEPFPGRAAAYDATSLPVPVDLLVYTSEEWRGISREGRFADMAATEAVWVYNRLA